MTTSTVTLTPGEAERYRQNLEDLASICRTDPAFTKPVAGHGGYTSTDTFYLLTRAIMHYGPVGVGFGWEITASHTIQAAGAAPEQTLMVVQISFWTRSRSNAFSELGSWSLYEPTKDKSLRVDDEAPIKALTRAISKALSRLGFCADVFLGCHDKRPEDRAHPEMYLTWLESLVHGSAPAAPLQDFCSPSAAPRPATAPPVPQTPEELPKPPTSKQLEEIELLLDQTGVDISVILSSYKVERIDYLNFRQAETILKRLRLTAEKKAAVPA